MREETIIRHYQAAFSLKKKRPVVDIDAEIPYQFSFHIYRLEHILKELGGEVPPNRQSQHYLAFVKRGRGEKTIGLDRFPIADNSLFIVPERVIHASSYTGADYAGYVLCFNLNYFLDQAFPQRLLSSKLVLRPDLIPHLRLSAEQVRTLETIFERLLVEYGGGEQDMQQNEMVPIKLLELLVECDRLYAQTQGGGRPIFYTGITERLNSLIEKHFLAERSVAFYADALCLHPNRLNALVKQQTGTSVKKLLTDRTLLEARYLLRYSSLSVKELAGQLGFPNADYFSAFFKLHVGHSPSQYRAA